MPNIKAPDHFRDAHVCVGVHTIELDNGVGSADGLNAGELAHLQGRGFTLCEAPAKRGRPAPTTETSTGD